MTKGRYYLNVLAILCASLALYSSANAQLFSGSFEDSVIEPQFPIVGGLAPSIRAQA